MEFWLQLAGIIAGCGAIYGGIRADIKVQRESIARAHQRIDQHLTEHWRRQ